MATIKDYNSQETPPNPIDTSSEAKARAGAGMHALGNTLTAAGETIQKYQDLQQGSKLTIQSGALHAKLTNEWEQMRTTQDITDPDVVKKFNDHVNDEVSKLSDNINSPNIRRHAAEIQGTIRDQFSVKTNTDHTTAVGALAVQAIEYGTNSLSASAASDDTAYEATRQLVHPMAVMTGVATNKVPEVELHLGKELAKASVIGMIGRGHTDQAREDIESGRFDKDLDTTEKSALLTKVKTAEDALRADERYRLEKHKQDIKDTSDAAEQEYHEMFADPDYVKSEHQAEYNTDKRLTPEAQERLTHYQNSVADRIKRQGEPQPQEQPGLVAKFMDRLERGTLTDNQLLDGLKDGDGLSVDNYKFLYGRLHTRGPQAAGENRLITAVLDNIRLNVVGPKPSFMQADPMTPDQSRDRTAAEAYLFSRIKGLSGQALLDALTPGSKTEVLTPAVMAQFALHTKKNRSTLGEIKAEAGGAPAKPAAPTKSLADFLKGQ